MNKKPIWAFSPHPTNELYCWLQTTSIFYYFIFKKISHPQIWSYVAGRCVSIWTKRFKNLMDDLDIFKAFS